MATFRAAITAAALLPAALWLSDARAEAILQTGMFGFANRLPGMVGRNPQTGGITLGTTLFHADGSPISTDNPLPVNAVVNFNSSTLGQGTANVDASAGWYIRPGSNANMATETGGNLAVMTGALGQPATGPYSGSGDATVVSALKGIFGRSDAMVAGLGAPADSAYGGSGNATVTAALKGLFGRSDAAATTLGAQSDAAWSGSGSASLIAVQKRLASLGAYTASDVGVTPVGSSSVESGHVLKASAGQLFGFQANFQTCASAPCWVLVLDSAGVPADGDVSASVRKWYQVPQNATVAANWAPGPPVKFTAGITVVCSTTGPFTLTKAAQCAISGDVK